MRVTYDHDYFGHGPEILLVPHTDTERDMLERLYRECKTRGFGRTGDALRIQHVRIALTPAENESESK